MNMYKKIRFIYFLILFFIFSCKTSKLSKIKDVNFLLKSEVLNAYYKKHTTDLNHLILSGKASLQVGENHKKVSFKMDMKLKEKISTKVYFLGFPIGKASITPTHIEFYEKFSKVYLNKGISYLKNFLKIDLNYDQLERILQGKPLFDLSERELNFLHDKENLTYSFISKGKKFNLQKYQYQIDLDHHFLIKKQKLDGNENPSKESLSVEYKNWIEFEGSYFPKSITIFFNEKLKPLLSIEFTSFKSKKS